MSMENKSKEPAAMTALREIVEFSTRGITAADAVMRIKEIARKALK